MDWKGMLERAETSQTYEKGGAEGREEVSLDPEKLEKYDRLMGDDIARGDAGAGRQFSPEQTGEISPGPGRLSPEERKNKLEMLFGEGDFFEKPAEGESPDAEDKKSSVEGKAPEGRDEKSPAEGESPDAEDRKSSVEGKAPEGRDEKSPAEGESPDAEDRKSSVEGKAPEGRDEKSPAEGENARGEEPDREAEDNCERDDNGNIYKRDGRLLPDCRYTINGTTYTTDGKGRIISCDASPESSPEGSRDLKEQREAGGEDRQEDDDGGHILARVLGGSEGIENLIPMRRTLNRGDYKKMENEINKALGEGKEVTMHVEVEYDDDSGRPSRIRVEYTIDGKKTEVVFDNKENSTKLMDSLDQKLDNRDCESLREEIADARADGREITITSVKTEYDENGNPTRVTVRLLDESTGEKTEKVYQPGRE